MVKWCRIICFKFYLVIYENGLCKKQCFCLFFMVQFFYFVFYLGFVKFGCIGENVSEKENIGLILNSLVFDLLFFFKKGF